MEEAKARERAALILLQRGVRVTIPNAPFWQKWRRKHIIHIAPLKAGTIAYIDVLLNRYRLAEVKTEEQAKTKLQEIASVIAVAKLNDKAKIEKELSTNKLRDSLHWQYPFYVLFEVYLLLAQQNEVTPFTNITNFLQHLCSAMMSPRNLGQIKKGR